MKNLKISSESVNYSSIDLGNLDELMDYPYMHSKRHEEVKRESFYRRIIKSSSAEISFTVIPLNTEIPFFYKHKNNEEIYVVLKGSGQFQIDDSLFNVSEGSVIRISPEGKTLWS